MAAILAILCALTMAPSAALGRQANDDDRPGAIDTTAKPSDEEPRRQLIRWNEIDGKFTTFRFGLGFLVDAATFRQDRESEQQVEMDPGVDLRDFRILLKGRAKTKRPLLWSLGYMYDAADDEWRFRQTGVQIGFPEAKGNLFVGRTKEGYSMIKVMVGYHGLTMERSPALDAFVPILADGLKWSGYFPERRVFFHLGAFTDELSEEEKFATYDHQLVTRVGWVPISSSDGERLLHLAVMARDGDPDDGSLQDRSRPEVYVAPFFVDTGRFAADRALTTGIEAYSRRGSLLFGGEYNWQEVDAASGEQPLFHAGDAVASWLVTGETRTYNAPGGFFEAVSPERNVFDGGLGAWEVVLHLSYTDFDSGSLRGGTFWRLTPMVNWYLSDHLRFELAYGYGELDRFGLDGRTQFFQSRLQLTL